MAMEIDWLTQGIGFNGTLLAKEKLGFTK